MKEKCKICDNFGYYQNLNGEWIECTRCLLIGDYERMIKDEEN